MKDHDTRRRGGLPTLWTIVVGSGGLTEINFNVMDRGSLNEQRRYGSLSRAVKEERATLREHQILNKTGGRGFGLVLKF